MRAEILSGSSQWRDSVMMLQRAPQVPVALQIKPELWSGSQSFTECQRRIGRHPATPINDLVEARVSPAEMFGELLLRYIKRRKEFLQ